MARSQLCSGCHQPLDRALPMGGYCRACHAAAQREWRKKNRPNKQQEKKRSVRSRSRRSLKRGTLVQEPCKCGSPNTEIHHPDYSKPRLVEWLCRNCHLDLHYPQRRERLSSDAL